MAKIDPIKDLAKIVSPPTPFQGLRFSQGVILSWDPRTFENEIQWRGITLRNLAVLPSVDALSFAPGGVVGLLGWAPGGGMGTWWILGQISIPPLAEPVSIQGADIIITGGGDLIVEDGDITVQGGNDIVVEDGGRIRAEYDNGNNAIQYGSFTVTPGGDVHGLLIDDINGDDIFKAMRDEAGNTFVIGGVSGGGPRIDTFAAYANFIEFSETSGGVIVTSGTTGDAANVRLASTPGFLLRETSAAKYKQDIADLIVDPAALLKLRLRTWRDKGDVEKNPDSDHWNVGLVAEEVVDAGLSEFVDYNEDGEPDAIQYNRLAVALVAVVQDQERRLQDVEARLAALDGQPVERAVVAPTQLPKRILQNIDSQKRSERNV